MPRDLRSAARAGRDAFGDQAADLPQEKVREWFDQWASEAQPEAAKALTQEVIAELRRRWLRARERRQTQRRETETVSSSSSESAGPDESGEGDAPEGAAQGQGQGDAPTEVGNTKGRITHKIFVGPPTLEARNWVTACGWRFGRSTYAQTPQPEWKQCALCFGGGDVAERRLATRRRLA